jgi:hypothetical protein
MRQQFRRLKLVAEASLILMQAIELRDAHGDTNVSCLRVCVFVAVVLAVTLDPVMGWSVWSAYS